MVVKALPLGSEGSINHFTSGKKFSREDNGRNLLSVWNLFTSRGACEDFWVFFKDHLFLWNLKNVTG